MPTILSSALIVMVVAAVSVLVLMVVDRFVDSLYFKHLNKMVGDPNKELKEKPQ